MAKAAGHEVLGEQDELTLDGVVGHRDCVIDGCIVDVKTTSRFDVNNTTIDDAITVTNDTIKCEFILLSQDFMACRFGHTNYIRFKDMSVGVFNSGPGR